MGKKRRMEFEVIGGSNTAEIIYFYKSEEERKDCWFD